MKILIISNNFNSKSNFIIIIIIKQKNFDIKIKIYINIKKFSICKLFLIINFDR